MDYDVVIIGAGPGGIAASVKAEELGLDYLVIEKGDDILAGMAGFFPPGKSVYPSVPKGSQNTFAIPFLKPPEDKISAEDYVKRVKEEVNGRGLKINFGEEFVGFKKDMQITVQTRQKEYKTKNLVLAIGSSIPRDLNIYGEARAITRILRRPEDYKGKNVLVIGGGNAGADVVMSLSKMKRECDDHTTIYWAHWSEKFSIDREVSRDLGEEIFLGGNIRILPGARPILSEVDRSTGGKGLAIITDEHRMEDDVKLTHGMCFPLENVIACIGFKEPTDVFEKIGIDVMVQEGGRRNTGIAILDDNLQTSIEGVYAIGGAISPSYILRTMDGKHHEKVRHPNFIYTAARDGSSVIERIAEVMKSSNRI